jgi:hypothetical protein
MSSPSNTEWFHHLARLCARQGDSETCDPPPPESDAQPTGYEAPPTAPPPIPAAAPGPNVGRNEEEYLDFEDAMQRVRRWLAGAEVKAWWVRYAWWVRVSGGN